MLETVSKKQYGLLVLAAVYGIGQGGDPAFMLGSIFGTTIVTLILILAYNHWQLGRAEQA